MGNLDICGKYNLYYRSIPFWKHVSIFLRVTISICAMVNGFGVIVIPPLLTIRMLAMIIPDECYAHPPIWYISNPTFDHATEQLDVAKHHPTFGESPTTRDEDDDDHHHHHKNKNKNKNNNNNSNRTLGEIQKSQTNRDFLARENL